jgi:hypothetical protein
MLITRLTRLPIFIVLILFFNTKFSFGTSANPGSRFSIGGEICTPLGTFGKAQGVGFGATMRIEAPLGDYSAMMVTAGYLFFTGKIFPGETKPGPTTYLIPIQLGIKYYIPEQQNGFYLMVEGGSHGYKASETDTTGALKTKPKFAFSYGPQIGLFLLNFDVGAKLQLISTPGNTTTYIGLRLAYAFGER